MKGAAIVVLLILEAQIWERGVVDDEALKMVQRLDLPGLGGMAEAIHWFATSGAAFAVWLVGLLSWAIRRRWSGVIVSTAAPLAAVLGALVGTTLDAPPSPDQLVRHTEAGALGPIAHVAGLVVLLGLLVEVESPHRHIGWLALRVVSGLLMAATGLAYLWLGMSWPLDVVLAYGLGGSLLAMAIGVQRRLAAAVDGLPFVHAGEVPHDESLRHAHALTSTILFEGDRVAKIYRPGLLPRALYWLAFQAPFAYESSDLALRAALHRRNLAGRLTEYWYGTNRVAPALAVERIDGRPALISALVDGREPVDHAAARRFLRELSDRFDETGLPTWQIDPRQPRSLGNVLEGSDGTYTIIDLESGLVSPLASPRAWWRAVRRALVPFYDDVYFDLTRAYVEREESAMRRAFGDAWFRELVDLLDSAETEAWAWHRSEPRVWSRLARALQPELGGPPAALAASTRGAGR